MSGGLGIIDEGVSTLDAPCVSINFVLQITHVWRFGILSESVSTPDVASISVDWPSPVQVSPAQSQSSQILPFTG